MYVVIRGSGLEQATDVTFGGVSSGFVTWSDFDQSLIAAAPEGGSGTVDVIVTSPAGTSAPGATAKFTYVGPPVITSTEVFGILVIRGQNLFGIQDVLFGTEPATGVFDRNTDDASTGTEVRATWSLETPPTGLTTVTVSAIGGAASVVVDFSVIPTVTAITPASGSSLGGTSVTVTGTGFVAGSTSVAIGTETIPVTGVVVASSTSLTFTTPAHAAGNVAVAVTTPSGSSGAVPGGYTYTTTTAPVAGPVSAVVAYGSTATPIPLNLTGDPAGAVAIATQAAHGVATASGTSVTYTPAAGYGGPDSFTYVATNDGGASSPATVSVTVSPPVITFTPATLPNGTSGASYSQTLTASGGQAPYGYSVSTGTLPSGLSLDPSTGVLSGIPDTEGSSSFTVRARDASAGSGPYDSFRAYTIAVVVPAPAAPIVSGLSPTGGPAAGGVLVTLTGSGFTGATSVTFGGQTATFTLVSDTTITATAPSGSGAVRVVVTTASGSNTDTAGNLFTYAATEAPPEIPTMSEWMLGLLALALACGAAAIVHRRRWAA